MIIKFSIENSLLKAQERHQEIIINHKMTRWLKNGNYMYVFDDYYQLSVIKKKVKGVHVLLTKDDLKLSPLHFMASFLYLRKSEDITNIDDERYDQIMRDITDEYSFWLENQFEILKGRSNA